MNEMAPGADPVTKVARDLTAIIAMHAQLPTQAVNDSNSRLMPGGRAMHALGPVANMEAWANMQDTTERCARAYTSAEDEDPDDAWSAFQIIEFWSERWRVEHNAEYGQRPTIVTEANFLRFLLPWAWDNLMEWDDFAADIARARQRLEDILSEGERSERGVPCMYDECEGKRLVRKLVPYRDAIGDKAWRYSDWHCARCKRSWDDDAYWRNVGAANNALQSEEIEGETWCSIDYAARKVSRPASTIRVWLHRKELAAACMIRGRRTNFVRLADVIDRDLKARRSGRGRSVA